MRENPLSVITLPSSSNNLDSCGQRTVKNNRAVDSSAVPVDSFCLFNVHV